MNLSPELIKALNENQNFQAFKKWLTLQILQLDSVDGLEKMSDEEAGQEARVRSKTKTALTNILSEFIINERKEPSIEQLQKVKRKSGL